MTELTKVEAYFVANFIDTWLFQAIRDDADIDNMPWLLNLVHAYEKMCKDSGYVGLTDKFVEETNEDS